MLSVGGSSKLAASRASRAISHSLEGGFPLELCPKLTPLPASAAMPKRAHVSKRPRCLRRLCFERTELAAQPVSPSQRSGLSWLSVGTHTSSLWKPLV